MPTAMKKCSVFVIMSDIYGTNRMEIVVQRETFFMKTHDKKIWEKIIGLWSSYKLEEVTLNTIFAGVVSRWFFIKMYMTLFCCNQVLFINIYILIALVKYLFSSWVDFYRSPIFLVKIHNQNIYWAHIFIFVFFNCYYLFFCSIQFFRALTIGSN